MATGSTMCKNQLQVCQKVTDYCSVLFLLKEGWDQEGNLHHRSPCDL